MNDKYQNIRIIDKIAMFIIGIINNAPYVIGIASADRIVASYNEPSYLGIILWADTFSGLFSRFLNSFFVSKNVPYEVNFVANLIMLLLGLLLCAFVNVFWVTCIGVFLIGFSSNLGESVMLCYMTNRHKQGMLKSWSSGTGMAGIAGAGYSFLCASIDIPSKESFLYVTPVPVVYALLFFAIIRRSPASDTTDFDQSQTQTQPTENKNVGKSFLNHFSPTNQNEEIAQPMLQQEEGNYMSPETGHDNYNNTQNESHEPKHVCDCSYFHFYIWQIIINCGLVYFLEYSIQGVFAHCCLTKEQLEKQKSMYSFCNLCYQCGVFISRSSLILFHFPWIWILTVFQAGMFVLWFCQCEFHFIKDYPILLALMVVVGLCGGCSYVNAFNIMMNHPTLSTKQKEMVTSWNSFFISFFIILSTGFTFVAEKTFMIPPSLDE